MPLTASPAFACSCAGLPLAASARNADAVFVGTVLDRTDPTPEVGIWSSTDKVTYTVQVGEVYKGSVRANQQVVSVASGASCGLEVEFGRRYVFFPSGTAAHFEPIPGPGQLVGDLCDGTAIATAEVEERLQAALGPPHPPRPPAPDQAGPPLMAGIGVAELLFLLVFGWLFGDPV